MELDTTLDGLKCITDTYGEYIKAHISFLSDLANSQFSLETKVQNLEKAVEKLLETSNKVLS